MVLATAMMNLPKAGMNLSKAGMNLPKAGMNHSKAGMNLLEPVIKNAIKLQTAILWLVLTETACFHNIWILKFEFVDGCSKVTDLQHTLCNSSDYLCRAVNQFRHKIRSKFYQNLQSQYWETPRE